jgi:LacI family transcriptional regulator
MGYSPNLLARSLSSQKTNTLGVVVPKIAHTFFATAIQAIQAEATRRGYGIVLAVSNERSDLECEHIERLLAMRVDGLLISVSQQTPDLEIYEQIRTMRIPLVFFDRRIEELPFSCVIVDDFGGAKRAVERMIEKGYRRIAHIAGSLRTEIGRTRCDGYRQALANHGIPINEEWIIDGGFDEWHGYRAAKHLLAGDEPPEVIFAVTFPVGLGVRAAVRDSDSVTLDDLQIVSFGVGGFDEFFLYPHFCIRQPTDEMGRQAVKLLLEEVDALDAGHEPPKPTKIVLETSFMEPSDRDGLDISALLPDEEAAPSSREPA